MKKTPVLIVTLMVVGILLLISPILWKLITPANTAKMLETAKEVSSGITFDLVYDRVTKVIGTVTLATGAILQIRSMRGTRKSPRVKRERK